MKKLLLSLAIVMCVASINFAQTVHKDYLDGAIWVKLKQPLLQKAKMDFNTGQKENKPVVLSDLSFGKNIERFGVHTVIHSFPMVNDAKLNTVYRIEFSEIHSVDQLMRIIQQDEGVEYVERVPFLQKTVNDPSYNSSTQWNLFQVNAAAAWNIGTGSANIRVAIVDDAVQINHPDLQPSIWINPNEIPNNGIDDDGNGYIDDVNGWDAANQTNNPNPPANSWDHGTHVAGIAGAATNNGIGMASIGHNLKLIPVKATNSATAVTHGYEGVIYAVAAGAHVINMSWGGAGASQTAQNIIAHASNQGIVLVAAAGNDNVSSIFYPAGFSQVIAVASTTFGDSKSGFSNFGSWIDISAPGSAIYSTVPGNGYQVKQGTSMASPMVAGLAGLMLSLNPGLSPQDIKNCLLNSADNIDAANPSFVGQLGAGRINALAAMNCVSSTLNWAPEANFVANQTTIMEGQSVTFTDQSIYNPTSWQWTFTGGSPATFNGQNPPAITYATAGTYPVSLTVTNANGSDTETKNGYITVTALTGCDTISNTLPSDLNYIFSFANNAGYVAGHNNLGVSAWADKYSNLGPTNVTGAQFYFVEGQTNNPNAFITVRVWAANASGNPGNILYSQQVPISEIEANVTGAGPNSFFITNINFHQAVAVPTNDFFVGYTLTNGVAGDTVACAITDNFAGNPSRPNTMWAQFNGTWDSYQNLTNNNSKFSMHIYPRITSMPPQAVIQPSASTVCVGDFITFDGSNSPNTVAWQWAINGTSSPFPTQLSPQVVMNNPGSHWAYMLAENVCGFFHIDSVQVTVNALPSLQVTASTDTICPGGTAQLNATGTGSITWSPAGSLSCSTCPNPVASPNSTTTYSIVAENGGCSSESLITIVVDGQTPTANFLMSSDTICEGQTLNLNGGISDGASQFAWTINGGSPSTSTGAVTSAEFANPGSFEISLTATNSCGLSDNTSRNIIVVDMANCPLANTTELMADLSTIFFDATQENLVVDLTQVKNKGTLNIYAMSGQLVYSGEAKFGEKEQISLSHIAPGVYNIQIISANEKLHKKFVR
jgi:serine protease